MDSHRRTSEKWSPQWRADLRPDLQDLLYAEGVGVVEIVHKDTKPPTVSPQDLSTMKTSESLTSCCLKVALDLMENGPSSK